MLCLSVTYHCGVVLTAGHHLRNSVEHIQHCLTIRQAGGVLIPQLPSFSVCCSAGTSYSHVQSTLLWPGKAVKEGDTDA